MKLLSKGKNFERRNFIFEIHESKEAFFQDDEIEKNKHFSGSETHFLQLNCIFELSRFKRQLVTG